MPDLPDKKKPDVEKAPASAAWPVMLATLERLAEMDNDPQLAADVKKAKGG